MKIHKEKWEDTQEKMGDVKHPNLNNNNTKKDPNDPKEKTILENWTFFV